MKVLALLGIHLEIYSLFPAHFFAISKLSRTHEGAFNQHERDADYDVFAQDTAIPFSGTFVFPKCLVLDVHAFGDTS